MSTLYITEPGARLEKEYQRLRVVDAEGQTLLATPLARVSEVVLVGWVGVTTPAMIELLEAGVGLTLLGRQGRLLGRLIPPTGKNLPLRREQYRRADDEAFGLRLSQAIVAGKLRNSRTLARRMLRGIVSAPPGQIERLAACLKAVGRLERGELEGNEGNEPAGIEALAGQSERELKELKEQEANKPAGVEALAGQESRAMGTEPNRKSAIVNRKSLLMGLEGQGAKAYFAIFRAALRGELTFGARSRRPPADPVNALLSLGYSLLTANLISALELVGLDPYCGFFHGQAYGRPALALDLMEEFRPIVVDSVVLSLVNKRMLTAEDFEPGRPGGIYLNRRGRRVFFEQYTARLNTELFHPLAGRALSYQKIFELQARQLAKLIQAEIDEYQPFLVK
jgi:CRISPR/Cas system-associated endonuclease Cas1